MPLCFRTDALLVVRNEGPQSLISSLGVASFDGTSQRSEAVDTPVWRILDLC